MNTFPKATFAAFLLSFGIGVRTVPAQSTAVTVPARIVAAIDNSRVVTLTGNTHPLARAEFDRGAVDPQMPMTHMLLLLQRSAEQEAALEKLMAEQMDRNSTNYHQWLTPTDFGQKFGVSDADLAQVKGWLQSQGLSVDKVSNGRVTLEFSGPASQVQAAFHTSIHSYQVKGESHFSNASDPAIPEALAPVVAGVTSLNNFFPESQAVVGRTVRRDAKTGSVTPVDEPTGPTPDFVHLNSSNNTVQDVTPGDFATIYNVLPLWNAGINGAGQTIAIAGQSDINVADIAAFQASFGMTNNPPTIIHNGTAPGLNSSQLEQELDVEWSGAVAPAASITLVISPTTGSTGGFQLSAQYVIDNQIATILSESYGQCEEVLGSTGNATMNSLWQQGAAEGISIFGSAGDQGSTGCDTSGVSGYSPAGSGTQAGSGAGLAVNGIASSPYITAVGGTEFSWQQSPSTYWGSTNSATYSNALGYIPEAPWNGTCVSPYLVSYFGAASAEANCNTLAPTTTAADANLAVVLGGSGGVSACTTYSTQKGCSGGYAKPSWQTGTGVPADGKRDLPDVSLFASAGFRDGIPGSAYIICFTGSASATGPCSNGTTTSGVVYQEIGGTSVSAPAMAGVMALVQQKLGAAQGLANPTLYQLSAAESSLAACNSSTVTSGNSCVFYDTTASTNAMPCKSGTTNCTVNTKGDTLGVESGYSSTTGYDLTTGLGSVNVANLVNAWAATPSPTITFSIPNQTYGAANFKVAATSNSPGAFTYAIVSGPATISGSTITITGMGTVIVSANQAASPGYKAETATASFTVSPASTSIAWSPTTNTLFAGTAIGNGILDATGSVQGTIAYTATLGSGAATAITSASTLVTPGVYTLTANFTPSSSSYGPSTARMSLTVTAAYIWAINPSGSFTEFYGNVPVYNSAISGGGVAAAVDSGGNLWTINAGGSSLAEFNSGGSVIQSGLSGGGLTNATALVIDGNGTLWLTSGNNSVVEFSNGGSAISPSSGYTYPGGNVSSPSGIAIDTSGNVWISNAGNNSVTEVLGAAMPVSPTAVAVKNATLGVRP